MPSSPECQCIIVVLPAQATKMREKNKPRPKIRLFTMIALEIMYGTIQIYIADEVCEGPVRAEGKCRWQSLDKRFVTLLSVC